MQKQEEKQWKEELENIAAEPFARAVDDARLEDARKAEIRPDDPMAAYMAKVTCRMGPIPQRRARGYCFTCKPLQ